MRTEIITITPEMAKEMLDRNMKSNRRINHEAVRRYARIMKAGGWNLTHQGIAFDMKGQLVDGQHRLEAIALANVPIRMMVTYDLEHTDGESLTIDMGRKRTTLNIMQISGISDSVYKDMAGIVGSYMRYKMTDRGSTPEASEIIGYIFRHYEELEKIHNIIGCHFGGGGRSGRRLHTIVGVAITSAFYRGESEEALKKFIQVYCNNDVSHCEAYNPRHALNLRDYVRSHKNNPETLQRCECAIYSFANNQTQMKICDRYPYMPSLDA